MYKLVSLDLDGTLLNSASSISERNFNSLSCCHYKGVVTVIATGRPPRYTLKLLPEPLASGYVVCYNGARIYYNHVLLRELSIHSNFVEELLNTCSKAKIALEIDDDLYTNFDENPMWPQMVSKKIVDLKSYEDTLKILIINDEHVDVDQLIRLFGHRSNIVLTYNNQLIEITAQMVSKAEALNWIANRLNLAMENVLAFGDDNNDFAIIQAAGWGVAMGNSNQAIKHCADEVTLSNDEDGVAVVIERLMECFHE
ncbi:MAG: HAD family phosphatase [Clostridia bacterium]|nr:HAD family phosphatase [Clostridia bacterium]